MADRWRLILCGLLLWPLLALAQAPPPVVGVDCLVAWEQPPSPQLNHFRLYKSAEPHASIRGQDYREWPASPIHVTTTFQAPCSAWGVTPGEWSIRLTAVNADGQESAWSEEERIGITFPIERPTLLVERFLSPPSSLLASTGFATTHPASHLLDGCVADTQACKGGAPNVATVQMLLDLGGPYRLTRARLFGDAVGNWVTTTWSVEFACTASGPWGKVITAQLASGTAWVERPMGLVEGRYLRVTLQGQPGGTEAREVEVYGVPGGSCP